MGKTVPYCNSGFFHLSFYLLVYKKSAVAFVDNSVGLQVINKLPQALDFYLINVNKLMVPLGLILNILVKYARNITE
jgi:hypothetical protein